MVLQQREGSRKYSSFTPASCVCHMRFKTSWTMLSCCFFRFVFFFFNLLTNTNFGKKKQTFKSISLTYGIKTTEVKQWLQYLFHKHSMSWHNFHCMYLVILTTKFIAKLNISSKMYTYIYFFSVNINYVNKIMTHFST